MLNLIKRKAADAWHWYWGRILDKQKRIPTLIATLFVVIVLVGLAASLGCTCNPSNPPEAPSCDGGSCSV